MNKNLTSNKTYINDLVLIYKEEIPQFFARVEDISEDAKPGWFHLTLLVLIVPLQEITWILRDIYIDGEEFSMEGQKMRIEKIVSPSKPKPPPQKKPGPKKKNQKDSGKILSFPGLKK